LAIPRYAASVATIQARNVATQTAMQMPLLGISRKLRSDSLLREVRSFMVLYPCRVGVGVGERVGSAPDLGVLCIRSALPIGVAKCGFVADGDQCDDEESSHVSLPFEVVVLSDVYSIGYRASNVNPNRKQFQNFLKVICVP